MNLVYLARQERSRPIQNYSRESTRNPCLLRPRSIGKKEAKPTREDRERLDRILSESKRPTKRSDCLHSPRPCPWVSCRYHLYMDVDPDSGQIKLNFPGLEVWELRESCAFDVAERGGLTLFEVARCLNLSRERIRQCEIYLLRILRIILEQ